MGRPGRVDRHLHAEGYDPSCVPTGRDARARGFHANRSSWPEVSATATSVTSSGIATASAAAAGEEGAPAGPGPAANRARRAAPEPRLRVLEATRGGPPAAIEILQLWRAVSNLYAGVTRVSERTSGSTRSSPKYSTTAAPPSRRERSFTSDCYRSWSSAGSVKRSISRRALDAHLLMSSQALNSEVVRAGIKDILLNHAQLWETLRSQSGAGPVE